MTLLCAQPWRNRPGMVGRITLFCSGQRLVKLTDSALKEGLGISSFGHRMSLLEAIEGLGKAAAFPVLSAAPTPAGSRPKPRASVVANTITVELQVWASPPATACLYVCVCSTTVV